MGLKDDMDALQRHIDNGTGREFMRGTADPLPMPTLSDIRDRSIPAPLNAYRFVCSRGD